MSLTVYMVITSLLLKVVLQLVPKVVLKVKTVLKEVEAVALVVRSVEAV